jgi:hypothetical protein
MKYILKRPNGDQTTLTRDGLANRLGNGVVHEDWLVRPEDGTDWITVAELLASAPSAGELAQANEGAARTGPPEGSPTPSAERLGSPQSGGMDFQKLAKFILAFGAVVLCVGAFQALSNQPLPEPPPDDGKFKGWNDFNSKILDPTKNGLGVAVLNMDRANGRAQGYKVMGFGAIVVFVGVAIGRSAKPSRS